MLKHAMLSGAVLVFMTAGALAQTTTSQSTTVTQPTALPPMAAPTPGTSSSTESQRTVDGNGNEYDSTKTTYGTADGTESQTTTTSMQPAAPQPAPEVVTTTKKTTTVSTSN